MSRWRSTAIAVARNTTAMRVVDRGTSTALRLGAPPFYLFTLLGPRRLPASTKALKRMGLFPIRDHYYRPLFNDAHLRRPLSEPRSLPGIDWRHAAQVSLLGKLEFADELRALRLDQRPASDLDFYMRNHFFESGDAEFLYALLRHLRPRRVLEVGSGHSTKIARLALQANARETGDQPEHVCIEPYEQPWLEKLGVEVVRERVEDVGLGPFARLEASDLLFIDSSHMIRPQGDVLFEFLEVLPQLASGVYVHVHDIFSPRDYPDQWVRRDVRMWNEQYLLEALVSDSDRYEIVAALNYLKHTEYDRLAAVCPYMTEDREPGSFYMRIR